MTSLKTPQTYCWLVGKKRQCRSINVVEDWSVDMIMSCAVSVMTAPSEKCYIICSLHHFRWTTWPRPAFKWRPLVKDSSWTWSWTSEYCSITASFYLFVSGAFLNFIFVSLSVIFQAYPLYYWEKSVLFIKQIRFFSQFSTPLFFCPFANWFLVTRFTNHFHLTAFGPFSVLGFVNVG